MVILPFYWIRIRLEIMHIGMIGGIGPAATDFYYRRLILTFARRQAPLELTIVHADTPTLLNNLANNNSVAQTAIYMRLAQRLVSAKAECVVVTSIAGHFCIGEFKARCPLPVIDLIEEVNRVVAQRGLKRIGILGTRTVMETRLYGRISNAELIPPRGSDLDDVHQAYVAMAATGVVTTKQREVFNTSISKLLTQDGAEAIMLGGTDLALAFNEVEAQFPLVDCAAIHVDAIATLALAR
jgi:aspartate racemase